MKNQIIFTHDPKKCTYQRLDLLEAWVYIIKPYSPPRNLDQNAKYHVLLWWVELQTGNDHEYMHEMMKKKFLAWPRKRIKLNGKITYEKKLGSTTKLTKKQFSEFYQRVELFFLENWVPPLPPYDSLEYQNLLESYRG